MVKEGPPWWHSPPGAEPVQGLLARLMQSVVPWLRVRAASNRRPPLATSEPFQGRQAQDRPPDPAREITDAAAGVHRGARERGDMAARGAAPRHRRAQGSHDKPASSASSIGDAHHRHRVGQVITIAGIQDGWTDPESKERMQSCSMVITAANKLWSPLAFKWCYCSGSCSNSTPFILSRVLGSGPRPSEKASSSTRRPRSSPGRPKFPSTQRGSV
jgi:hypothetical protein